MLSLILMDLIPVRDVLQEASSAMAGLLFLRKCGI